LPSRWASPLISQEYVLDRQFPDLPQRDRELSGLEVLPPLAISSKL
jgi:hypothetical protein